MYRLMWLPASASAYFHVGKLYVESDEYFSFSNANGYGSVSVKNRNIPRYGNDTNSIHK